MVQVKFYNLSIYDFGEKHNNDISGKLYCSISNINDLSSLKDFDDLVKAIKNAKQEFIEMRKAYRLKTV